ncbi:MAG: DUF1905 domain-containing protein [Williamsia sp.]|nr:DUF1905 domain-containing protein [Williamsia sp.]
MKKISFETTILQTGNNTGICVPDEVVEQLGAGKRLAVNITINGFTYRNTIAVMGGKYMVSVSADVRKKAGVKGGDKITVELELDAQPREVELPADFSTALDAHPAAKKFYESLSFSNKQRYVLPIGQAKTEETRQRRIEKAIADLSAEKK